MESLSTSSLMQSYSGVPRTDPTFFWSLKIPSVCVESIHLPRKIFGQLQVNRQKEDWLLEAPMIAEDCKHVSSPMDPLEKSMTDSQEFLQRRASNGTLQNFDETRWRCNVHASSRQSWPMCWETNRTPLRINSSEHTARVEECAALASKSASECYRISVRWKLVCTFFLQVLSAKVQLPLWLLFFSIMAFFLWPLGDCDLSGFPVNFERSGQ